MNSSNSSSSRRGVTNTGVMTRVGVIAGGVTKLTTVTASTAANSAQWQGPVHPLSSVQVWHSEHMLLMGGHLGWNYKNTTKCIFVVPDSTPTAKHSQQSSFDAIFDRSQGAGAPIWTSIIGTNIWYDCVFLQSLGHLSFMPSIFEVGIMCLM